MDIAEIDNAHVICLMYKLILIIRDSDKLSIGFNRDITTRERELTNIKQTNGSYHLRIYSKVVFGFAEQQKKCFIWLRKQINITK